MIRELDRDEREQYLFNKAFKELMEEEIKKLKPKPWEKHPILAYLGLIKYD